MVLFISFRSIIANALLLKVQVLSCRGDCVHRITSQLLGGWIFVSSYNQQRGNLGCCLKWHFWDYKLNARDDSLMGGSLHFLMVGGCWGLSASHTFHPSQKCERSGPAEACFARNEFLPAGILRLWFTGATERPAELISCLVFFPDCQMAHYHPVYQEIFQQLLQLHNRRVFANPPDMTLTSVQQFTWWGTDCLWLYESISKPSMLSACAHVLRQSP